LTFFVGDWVLSALEREISALPPERGGALLGPAGRLLVTSFEPDPEATCSASSYRPSRSLDLRVRELERGQGVELKGVAHSHPGRLRVPSEQDARELAVGLALNGHMPCYLAPIVTTPATLPLEEHELALGEGQVSFFAAYRERGGGARVAPQRVLVVPLLRDLARLARELGGERPEVFLSDAGRGELLAGRVALPGPVELLLLASEHYPLLSPLLLVTAEGRSEQLELALRAELPEEERLVEAVRRVFRPPGPYRRSFGPRGGRALTRDPERAALADFEVRYGAEDVEGGARSLGEALLARGRGLLSPALRARHVLLVGLGSVGSYLGEQLARSGVGRFTLVDPERVEAVNLSRTAYEASDLGRPKAEALSRRLLRVDPALGLARFPVALEALPPEELDRMVRAADLVVAATDDPAAQRSLNRFAYARKKPALFVGLYAGAEGGEVLLTLPERTPCYLCATRVRHAVEEQAGPVTPADDYGTARLAGERALGSDVQHVASAAVKLGLALLSPEGDEGALARLGEEIVAGGQTYLTLSTVPRYWFYPHIFGETAGQGAFQSVWLTPLRRPSCPVCGDPEERVDPLEVPLRAPRPEAFEALARGG